MRVIFISVIVLFFGCQSAPKYYEILEVNRDYQEIGRAHV